MWFRIESAERDIAIGHDTAKIHSGGERLRNGAKSPDQGRNDREEISGTSMTDRIDQYWGGTLDKTQLTAEERAAVEAVERAIHETRAFVDARPTPDLAAGVMQRITRTGVEPTPKSSGLFARCLRVLWTAQQVSFRFRPAYGLLALAGVGIIAMSTFWPLPWRSATAAPTTASDTTPKLFVQFRLQANDASSVRLAGSFTNWQPLYELRRTMDGNWTITVPLSPGVHDYAFVVDGERWIADPYAPAVKDGFGSINSRIALLIPEDSQL